MKTGRGERQTLSRAILRQHAERVKHLRVSAHKRDILRDAARSLAKGRALPRLRVTCCARREGGDVSIEIFYAGRVVGETRADGYFQKVMHFSRHLLQKPKPSIALNVDVLDAAEQQGAHSCEIIDAESGEHYRASIAIIRARGFRVDRGMGLQLALPLTDWETDRERVEALPKTPGARQLSFWK